MIEEKILNCLQNIGCAVQIQSDVELAEFIQDSVMFITFIVELEQEFSIEIPDDYLLVSSFQTLHDVYLLIEDLTQQNK